MTGIVVATDGSLDICLSIVVSNHHLNERRRDGGNILSLNRSLFDSAVMMEGIGRSESNRQN